MNTRTALPRARDPLLFTPGPLTTSLSVKEAMLHDAGSWHDDFNAVVAEIRRQLLEVAGLGHSDAFTTILLQGSGTYGVEATIGSILPPDGKLLVLANGAYGERIVQMAKALRLAFRVIRCAENESFDCDRLDATLAVDPSISAVAVVHCETTTGILNPINAIGHVVKQHHRAYIVDAMSSFGGIPVDFEESGIDFLISSPNKCLEAVPGFCFVIARIDRLKAAEGCARCLSLDLVGQWKGFQKNGQFRFTPPTHSILACRQALAELDQEGGLVGRAARYAANHRTLCAGMGALGFVPFLPTNLQSPIITAFHYPADSHFQFPTFYQGLAERGFIIYPGKLTDVATFRIGTIGRITEHDVRQLLHGIKDTLKAMGCALPQSRRLSEGP